MMSENATLEPNAEHRESPLEVFDELERRVAYLELALTHLVDELGSRHLVDSDYKTRIVADSDRKLSERRDAPGA